MSRTNCINCGAAKEIHETKCPFCGTSYFDLTSIDFTSNKPVALQYMAPVSVNGRPAKMLITSLAVPELASIEEETEYIPLTNGFNHALSQIERSRTITSDISFRHVVKPSNQTLFEVEIKE